MGPSSEAESHGNERRVLGAVRRLAGARRLPPGAAHLGLDEGECAVLLEQVGEPGPHAASPPAEAAPAPLLPALIALLWRHRAGEDAWTRLMAGAIGSACFGERHLWQDLDLFGRGEVSALLERHFPDLAAGNTRGLRWKRYLFLRLGDELGIDDLAPPRCDGCGDFRVCFPAQEDQAVAVAIRAVR
jgi:nitrogen fixation protein NifQ